MKLAKTNFNIWNLREKQFCRNQDSNLGYYGFVVRCDPQRRVLTTRRLRLSNFQLKKLQIL